MNVDFSLFLPEFILAGAALLVIAVDLFLPERPQALAAPPHAGGHRRRRRLDGHPDRRDPEILYDGLFHVDGFSTFFKFFLLAVAAFMVFASGGLREAPPERPRRVLRHLPLLRPRHDDDGVGGRAPHRLHRPRALQLQPLRARRLRRPPAPLHRGRRQVHPDRGLLLRPAPLRPEPGLRRDGDDGLRRDRGRPHRRRIPGLRRWAGARHRGVRFQDHRRALSHVGPRRLRGRADAGHRLPRRRLQGRRLRPHAPALRRRPRPRHRRLAERPRRDGRAQHGGRQPRRHRPDQHQADALPTPASDRRATC